jgi:hypothetical protein
LGASLSVSGGLRRLLLLALLELLHQVHHGVCHLLVHAARRAVAHATWRKHRITI